MAQPKVSDLVFPEGANHKWPQILADLKRSNLSITNRLQSIRQDSLFVEEVAAACSPRPLVSNERCGSWYVAPDRKSASAYFKSTDGHTGQWKFSTRRLNLHLLELIGRYDGCIIVDSTRRGKSMPDALSKTVPIWCCVLNRMLFPEAPSSHGLLLPPDVVSASEDAQMTARIPLFVQSFRDLKLDMSPYRAALKKPLRTHWVTQDMDLDDVTGQIASNHSHPVICCTSSRRVRGEAEMSEKGYVQGAGDDTENWAHGLTPPVFWAHQQRLLATPEAEITDLIRTLVTEAQKLADQPTPAIEVAPRVYVAKTPLPAGGTSTDQCQILLTTQSTEAQSWVKSRSQMDVGLGKPSGARRNLRFALGAICSFASTFLQAASQAENTRTIRSVLIACDSGKDLSVGVALAVSCWCVDNDGKLLGPGGRKPMNKDSIRVRLGRIMTTMPDANPSRPTLQSVNSFLMERH
jgi:tRNA A64-2'-O-ribosylphosphate transferase